MAVPLAYSKVSNLESQGVNPNQVDLPDVPEVITTELTEFLGIKHPVFLAGMNVAAGPELAAAVTNAGGLGVIGGVGYTPEFLKEQIAHLKQFLKDPDAPFGVDLLLPQVGGNARKTNKDYTEGKLPELVDIIIESKARLFVSAVGIPPRWVVEKLHKNGILVMNMVGAPKHVTKALSVGVDIICAQGGEGGGHTGDVASSILIPACVDMCRNKVSELTKRPVYVVAAGGIFDGRGLAAALAWGAQAVWVGTRFICATEAGAPPRHQQGVIKSGFHDTTRTLLFTGRPMRVMKNAYISSWDSPARQDQQAKLLASGVLPYMADYEEKTKEGREITPDEAKMFTEARPLLMGACVGMINTIEPAAKIITDMVNSAVSIIKNNTKLVEPVARKGAKLRARL